MPPASGMSVKRLRRIRKRNRRKVLAHYTQGLTSKIPNVYRYKQTVTGSGMACIGVDFVTQGAAIINATLYFTLGDLPQVATFQALYDQYRIDKIKVSFIPMYQIDVVPQQEVTAVGGINAVPTPVATGAGLFGSVIDYDDASTLSGLPAYMQYTNWKSGQVASLKTHSRTVKPHIAVAAYQSGGLTAYKNEKSGWIDCGYPAVQHYGVKFYADIQANTSTPLHYPQTWRIICTYWVSFKNVR